ncbi:MAG: DUF493 domain-containing protein [Chromatiales bacterium]
MSDDELMEFPCEFPIKIFGENNAELRREIHTIIARHYGELEESRISERRSSGGRYVSITATIVARNRAQIDAIYEDLSASSHVVMSL